MSIFSVGNPFRGRMDWGPTVGGVGPEHYGMDFGSLRHTRFAVGGPTYDAVTYPWPAIVGLAPENHGGQSQVVSGMLRMFDMMALMGSFAKKAFGPEINAPIGTQSFMRFPDIVLPGLPKDTDLAGR